MGSSLANKDMQKKATNLSISTELLRQARELNINLSQTFEQHLTEIVREAKRNRWLSENQAALEAYNLRVEERGTFSDGLRKF